MRDVRALLRVAAHLPSQPVDVDEVVRRGRRARLRARAIVASAAVLMLAVVTVGMVSPGLVVPTIDDGVEPATSPPAISSPSAASSSVTSQRELRVPPEISALPFDERMAHVYDTVSGPERGWAIVQPTQERIDETDECQARRTQGRGCVYREIVLVNLDNRRIYKAYPFWGEVPRELSGNFEVLYCTASTAEAPAADGLCRIDLYTGEIVRHNFGSVPATTTPRAGAVAPPSIVATSDAVWVRSDGPRAADGIDTDTDCWMVFDPDTLEPLRDTRLCGRTLMASGRADTIIDVGESSITELSGSRLQESGRSWDAPENLRIERAWLDRGKFVILGTDDEGSYIAASWRNTWDKTPLDADRVIAAHATAIDDHLTYVDASGSVVTVDLSDHTTVTVGSISTRAGPGSIAIIGHLADDVAVLSNGSMRIFSIPRDEDA